MPPATNTNQKPSKMANDNYDTETKKQYKSSLAEVALSPLEDPRIKDQNDPQRLLAAAGGRFHRRFLRNMHGFALCVYDQDGKILFFAGAAFRRKDSETRDVVISMTPDEVLAGIKAGKPPEPSVIVLEGDARNRDHAVTFTDVPWFSAFLAHKCPTASGWGILRVGPASDKKFLGHLPNGTNAEAYLDPRSWKDMADAGSVPGSGSNDLTARLAPEALDLAESLISAWDVAVVMSRFFGGISKCPRVGMNGASKVLMNQCADEAKQREAKKVALAAARAARFAGGPGANDLDMFDGHSVAAAFDAAKEDGAA
jgi:hypothetical protein